MLILNEENKTVIVDNINVPIPVDYFWILDLNERDYMLNKLSVLEETTSPALDVVINNFMFTLPAHWNMLILDEETMTIDVAEISDLAGHDFDVMVYGSNEKMITHMKAQVVGYHPYYVSVSPFLNKHQMLCHPISPSLWVHVSPSDSYNKYIKNLSVSDLIA